MNEIYQAMIVLLMLPLIYFMAGNLISSYFKQKEAFVDRLQEKMKGRFDATRE